MSGQLGDVGAPGSLPAAEPQEQRVEFEFLEGELEIHARLSGRRVGDLRVVACSRSLNLEIEIEIRKSSLHLPFYTC